MTEPTSYRLGQNQKLAVTATHIEAAAVSAQTRVVRIKTTTDMWFAQGAAVPATTVSGGGVLMQAGDVEYVQCSPNEIFSFVRDTANGTVSFTECTR